MAPEIVLKTEFCGPPADIYASGVLLFAFFCGCFPYRGKNDKDLYDKIANSELVIPPHVPSEARSLLKLLLAKDPDYRPTSSELMLHSWVQSGFHLIVNAQHKDKPRSSSLRHRYSHSPQNYAAVKALQINTEVNKNFVLDYTKYDGNLTLQNYPFTDNMKAGIATLQAF
jgi:serine/threonine protein kinase